MLGFITTDEPGASDRLLSAVAGRLESAGYRLAGAVQENIERPDGGRCEMVVRVLGDGARVTISQDLGPGATGCRLDPGGLEQAAGLADGVLSAGADLLIVNKFGKQEIDGHGFRPLIGKALSEGIPVLLAVGRSHGEGFQAFADGMAEQIPPDPDALLDWVRTQASPGAIETELT